EININSSKNSKSSLSIDEKEKIRNKILKQLSDSINPDLDTISDAIYEQLNKSSLPVDKNTVKKSVQSSRHFRASREAVENFNSDSDTSTANQFTKETLSFVVDDVYEQLEKEDIRNKFEAKKADTKIKEAKKIETVTSVKQEDRRSSRRNSSSSKKQEDNSDVIASMDKSSSFSISDLDSSDDEDLSLDLEEETTPKSKDKNKDKDKPKKKDTKKETTDEDEEDDLGLQF
ncbi:MAG: hypothetical protein V1824_03695, partial [archaeon]